jgi:hypothetical protein
VKEIRRTWGWKRGNIKDESDIELELLDKDGNNNRKGPLGGGTDLKKRMCHIK